MPDHKRDEQDAERPAEASSTSTGRLPGRSACLCSAPTATSATRSCSAGVTLWAALWAEAAEAAAWPAPARLFELEIGAGAGRSG